MRRHSAATRHVLWTAAFAALLALPLLTVSLPALPIRQWMSPEVVFQATAPLRSRLGTEASEPRPSGSGPTSGAPAENRPGRAAAVVFFAWFAGTAISLKQMALAWLAAIRMR